MSQYYKQKQSTSKGKSYGVVIGFIVLLIVGYFAYDAIFIVDAGHRGVLLHWNAVDTTQPPLSEGLHFIIPIMDDVVQTEVRTLKYIKSTTAASKDLQTVTTTVTLNYKPDPNYVHVLYKSVGTEFEKRIIQPAVEEVVKQVTAQYNAEELITKRPNVKSDIEKEITNRLLEYNLITDVVSITDFQFSRLFDAAIEAKVEAEQKALKAENDLLRIEVEARQLEQKARGDANANIARANGEAEAIRIINHALATNPYYMEWLKTTSWNGKLPLVMGGDATPFIQIPVN